MNNESKVCYLVILAEELATIFSLGNNIFRTSPSSEKIAVINASIQQCIAAMEVLYGGIYRLPYTKDLDLYPPDDIRRRTYFKTEQDNLRNTINNIVKVIVQVNDSIEVLVNPPANNRMRMSRTRTRNLIGNIYNVLQAYSNYVCFTEYTKEFRVAITDRTAINTKIKIMSEGNR